MGGLDWSAPIPVAAWSKAQVYERSLVGMAGSNTAGGVDVCCECWRFLRRADLLSRGVLPSVNECDGAQK